MLFNLLTGLVKCMKKKTLTNGFNYRKGISCWKFWLSSTPHARCCPKVCLQTAPLLVFFRTATQQKKPQFSKHGQPSPLTALKPSPLESGLAQQMCTVIDPTTPASSPASYWYKILGPVRSKDQNLIQSLCMCRSSGISHEAKPSSDSRALDLNHMTLDK